MDKKPLFYPSLRDILASFPHFYHHIAGYALQKMRKIYSISQIWAKQFLEVPLRKNDDRKRENVSRRIIRLRR